MAATDAEFLQDGLDPDVAGQNLLVVSIIEAVPVRGKQVLGSVVSGEAAFSIVLVLEWRRLSRSAPAPWDHARRRGLRG